MSLTPPQRVMSHLINSAVGVTASSSRSKFQRAFCRSVYGEPDTLLFQCVRWFFKNGDFTEFEEDVKQLVTGQPLATFVDTHLSLCPEIIKIIIENAINKSKRVKMLIKKDEFAVCIGHGRLITIPFTQDMEEPAAALAEYTKMFFSVSANNIQYSFEGCYGIRRNMDITPAHIKLFSKIGPDHFAEKGMPIQKRERNGRLSIRMCRINWRQCGIYFNAVIDFFESYRGTVIVQGEHPACKTKRTYKDVLEHTLANPDNPLIDENPKLIPQIPLVNKRKRPLVVRL
ncbi:unnamed protein product [Caenorhabditis sp. 36 PRJEB53466]|nr:unnamed protein product [Caenorhabditis sp. 36 PRJEB53466]